MSCPERVSPRSASLRSAGAPADLRNTSWGVSKAPHCLGAISFDATELFHLSTELFQLVTFIGGEARALAGVGLGSADPLAKCFVVDRQLGRNGLDGLPLRRVLVLVVKHHPHGPFTNLRRYGGRRSAFALALLHPLKRWSSHQSRGDSVRPVALVRT